MGSEVKPAKHGLRRHLNAGFVAGFLLVLLTYVIVSQQFAMETPTAVTSRAPRIDENESVTKARVETEKTEQEWQRPKDTSGAVSAEGFSKRDSTNAKPIENGKVVCSSNGFYSDTCDVDGDVRINGTALSVTLVPASRRSERRREWKIQPYPRRTVSGIAEVTVTRQQDQAAAPACTVTHGVPGVVFALGGLTGNYWHDFSDVLVPLFVASRRYGGEVQFLVSNIQPWWLGKYEAVVRRLSRYDAVDLDRDTEVRCFRRVTVGLRMHKEFSVKPELAPGGQRLTMADFAAERGEGEMGGDHGKLMKSLKGAAQKYLGVGFLLGFFLVLLTYFTVSEQFAIAAPNAIRKTSPGHASPTIPPPVEEKRPQLPPIIEQRQAPKAEHEHAAVVQEKTPSAEEIEIQKETEEDHTKEKPTDDVTTTVEESAPAKKPACDIQGPWASDVCSIDGDVRIHGAAHDVVIPPPIEGGGSNPNPREWRVVPYSRKHMGGLKEVAVREVASAADAPACDVRSPVPALVFAMGGLTGNYWHDFSDVLIPLYLQARRFDGEVQLVVENIQMWYVGKYKRVLDRLSRHDIVDMDRDDKVRCFPGAVVGIRMHKEFSIDPARDPTGHSMPEFTKFLRDTFALPRDAPVSLVDSAAAVRPRLMIISRRHPRKLMNVEEVVRVAERIGFEVVIGDPPFNVDVGEFAREVNRADVLMGVHGAGLTNSVFLPTGAVLIQVVPYGKMEHIGKVDFGDPAEDMRLKYMAYSAGVEESTLVETLGRDHPAVRDPESVHRSGWGKVAEYYLGKQDIRLDLARFEPLLRDAMDYLKHHCKQVVAEAAARERKPRHSNGRVAAAAAAAKNLSKVEPGRHLAVVRLFPACLLALLICLCVVKFFSSLSSQSQRIGTRSRMVSSWEGSASTNVPRIPVAPLIMGRVDEDISTRSPELGSVFKNENFKNGTDSENKSRSERQVAISTENDPPPGKEESLTKSPQTAVSESEAPKPRGKISCDDKSKDEGFPYARPIVCHMSGDVRVSPATSSVILTMPSQQAEAAPQRIRPYARRDDFLLPLVREVAITSAASEGDAPSCNVSHGIPAVIFSIGGYTGNFFHDMADVLVPLYLTTFHFKGKVQLFVANYKQWWIQKYKPVLRRLSHRAVVDFDSDGDVHCFDHVIVGLVRDRDLILGQHPTRNPKGYTMVDFTRFLRHAYGLRRDKPMVLGETSGKKPRMLIISRRRTRKLLNLRQVAAMARELGFEVVVSEAGVGGGSGGVKRFASAVNSCDVLVGVHGAGLTNQAFLPRGGVVVQIVPWGRMEWMATNFYGAPAAAMELRYVEYHVAAEESSLARRYPREHAVFRDPMAIHGQGWKALADIVMTQDVKLNLRRSFHFLAS
uniref:Glycosyltransferase 61 catalytic domain-containing protein n=1 Tax=Oryza barthii TaxID=65489 RepID=A0A0D3EIZ9_9ORYZ